MAPSIVSASIQAIKLIDEDRSILKNLKNNTEYFRLKITDAGFSIKGEHPIVPIMLGDAQLAPRFSSINVEKGNICNWFFSFPVVPKGEARIRGAD